MARALLSSTLLLLLSGIVAGCGGGSSGTSLNLPQPTAAPATAPPAGLPVAGSPISHVIVVIQENRTVDNLFSQSYLTSGGPYPGANVATTFVPAPGAPPMALPSVPFEAPYDPEHDHTSLLNEYGAFPYGCGIDKVDPALPGIAPAPAGFACGVVPYFETIIYHTIAAKYALSDNTFSPRLVPSFPGHLFLVAGQSDPSDDPTDPTYWSCNAPAGTTVPVFAAATGEAVTTPGPAPCFDYQTIGDLLDAKHVSWKYYTGQLGNPIDGQVNVYGAIKHIFNGPDFTTNISTPSTNILTDIQNCNLPAVSYVTPQAFVSDHAGNVSNGGPGWVGSIYAAILASQNSACKYYLQTAMIVTWDDSGGWFDHVKPPTINGQIAGFRVPLIVASAWSAQSPAGSPLPYVSHTQHDFGAILRFIENNWGLGSLGTRDAPSDALQDMFNFSGTPVGPIALSHMRKLIDQTNYRSVINKVSSRPVDDDK